MSSREGDHGIDAERVREALSSPSTARERYMRSPSSAFSDFHRELPSWYTMMDVDAVEFDAATGEPYLAYEVITLGDTEADLSRAPATHPVRSFKRRVLEQLSAGLGVPTFTLYTTPVCDEFVVDRIDEKRKRTRLADETAFCDWLDEWRL